ncbi:MAG: M15 family metallopeptidase [Hydrogeniiclostridium mannosilyticum]
MKKTQGLRARNFSDICRAFNRHGVNSCLDPVRRTGRQATGKAVYESQPPKTDVSQPLQDDGDWNLILVNEDHPLPESFSVDCSQVSGGTVDTRIAGALQNMIAAGEQDGVSIYVSSGYRSVERQRALFDRAVQQNLAKGMDWELADATAAKSIARPGRSEHNTGLAVDLNGVAEDFDTTAEYRWLQENAEDFGFILRFPADKESVTGIRFEPWHYRYVGVEHAKEMNRLGMCLEEYIDYLNAQK